MGGRKYPSFDLFSDPPPPNLTPFQRQYVRDFDWASSPLGPVQYWPLQLRQMVNIVQRDKSGAVVYWDVPGKDGVPNVVIVYNEAYSHIMCVNPSQYQIFILTSLVVKNIQLSREQIQSMDFLSYGANLPSF